jgi:hypothetical protein
MIKLPQQMDCLNCIEARISVQSAQDFAKTHFEGAEGIFNWRDLSSRNFFFT